MALLIRLMVFVLGNHNLRKNLYSHREWPRDEKNACLSVMTSSPEDTQHQWVPAKLFSETYSMVTGWFL